MVGIHDGRRHELGSFVTGVTEHDSLIPCSLFGGLLTLGLLRVHTLTDVGGLGREKVGDENFVGVEDVVVVGVANTGNCVAHDLLDVDRFTQRFVTQHGNGDFTANHHVVALDEGFAGYAAVFVHLEAGVEDRVGNGITNLVGMAFANRFR